MYSGGNYTTLSVPGATDTWINGIDGNNIVGEFSTNGGSTLQGFIYNGSSYTTLNVPGATSTGLSDILGNDIVGYYTVGGVNHGFLYDGSKFTTIDYPGAGFTGANDIAGNTIIGNYGSGGGDSHGFMVTVPEPSAMALMGMGVGCLVLRSTRKRVHLPQARV
jgi:hypothetical protein